MQNASERPANLQKQGSSFAERCRSDDASEIYASTKLLTLMRPDRQQLKNVIVALNRRRFKQKRGTCKIDLSTFLHDLATLNQTYYNNGDLADN